MNMIELFNPIIEGIGLYTNQELRMADTDH